MKSVLSLAEPPTALERSFRAAIKLRRELPTDIEMESIPLMEVLSLVKNIHDKTREASQNMREFLGIEKAYKAYRVNI